MRRFCSPRLRHSRDLHTTPSSTFHQPFVSSDPTPEELKIDEREKDSAASFKPYKATIDVKGMLFDNVGHVRLINEAIKKNDLCASFSVFPRDLRKLDPTHSFRLPAVLVREKAIVVNLGHIRAVIQADQVVVFDSGSLDAGLQSMLVHELQGKIGAKDLPFELKALEAILINVVMKLDLEEDAVIPRTREFLKSLDDYVNQEKLKTLLEIRRELSKLDRKIDAIKAVLSEILNNDEDLAGLYISDRVSGRKRDVSEHMEAELMLEHYSRMVDGKSRIQSAYTRDIR